MPSLHRLALSTRFAPRALVPVVPAFVRPSVTYPTRRHFHPTSMANQPIATLDVRSHHPVKMIKLTGIGLSDPPSSVIFSHPVRSKEEEEPDLRSDCEGDWSGGSRNCCHVLRTGTGFS